MDRSIVVLHVDDEPSFAELTAELLERSDDRFRVLTETDADAGLDRLAAEPVDCVVSDYEMPGRNGLEFLERVREEHGELPFVLFTGKGSEEVASDAIAAGATDYLRKRSGTEQYELLSNRIRNAVEQHRAQVQRRRNERRFEAVFEDPEMLVALLDTDGTLLKANRTAMAFVEADHEEVVGQPFHETPWWTDELRPDVRRWVERAADGEYVEYEDDRIRPDGRPSSAHGTIRPVTDEDGEVGSLIVSTRDTTDRLETERRFEAVFDDTPRFLGLLDPDGTVVAVNETVLSAGDLDRGAVVGDPVWEIAPFATRDAARHTLREGVETARGGETFREELVFGDGHEERVIDLSIRPVLDERGETTLLVPEGRDVTARRKCERRLERRTERVEDLLELAREGGWAADPAPVALDPGTVVEECWAAVDAGDATLRTGTDRTVRADERGLRRLFETLLRDALDRGGDDVTVTVGDLDEGDGVYVADDAPGSAGDPVPSTGDVPSVARLIAETYGWDLSVTADGDGTRVEVSGFGE